MAPITTPKVKFRHLCPAMHKLSGIQTTGALHGSVTPDMLSFFHVDSVT